MNKSAINLIFTMKRFLLYVFLLLPNVLIWATHNRAGEISIKQTGPLTIEATITTYTKATSTSADRDSLTLEWGDGKVTVVVRSNGAKGSSGVPQGEVLGNDIKKNVYVSTHTYPGFAPFYVISMTDQNRNGSVKNVNFPNSDMIAFSISTTFSFLNEQFQGSNSTPQLLQAPIDFGCTGKVFTHNPSAFDSDGDSLYYYLTVPRQSPGKNVPGYVFPSLVGSNVGSSMYINSKTGDLVWDAPKETGEYNIAIMIIEYRNGIAIDSMVRDMQIFIEKCENDPPTLKIPKEMCVVAGQVVEFDVIGNDPNVGNKIKMTASGGPLSVAISPASYTVPQTFESPAVVGKFRWQTDCSHISNQYYSVVFRVVDDSKKPQNPGDEPTGLAVLKTFRIKVVAPPPLKVAAAIQQGNVNLTWEKPYLCDNAANGYFYGFSVWRKEGSMPMQRDTCAPGLTGKGYTKIAFAKKDAANGKYFFNDSKVERGKTYCYRIQAEFAKLTISKNPYNLVEGLWSDEICIQLNRDLPLLVNVDVEKTDVLTGEINVRWTKPDSKDLDTLLNKAPYRYELLRAEGNSTTFLPIANFTQNTFAAANDTFYKDNNINTLQRQFVYKINFYVNNQTQPLGVASNANSVFLTITPTDKTNILTWIEKTPWQNRDYIIYRKNDVTNVFDSINTVKKRVFRDENLTNGKNYCYYIKSIGSYGIKAIREPLLNRSQEVCAVPIDNVPPCATILTVENICTKENLNPADTITNYLSWRNPINLCKALDTKTYRIYAAKNTKEKLVLIKTIENVKDTTFAHEVKGSLAGCYYVTALDSLGNESVPSNTICVDNCPIYDLPNTFTPNGDGDNDLYQPFKNFKFISKVEMQIFNRWGEKVFETSKPIIDWDGKNQKGNELEEATYYYKCKVFEQRVEGIVPREQVLTGFVQLIRGQ